MSQMEFWDEATRKVIVARVESVPPIRFFSPEEARLMTAVSRSHPPRKMIAMMHHRISNCERN